MYIFHKNELFWIKLIPFKKRTTNNYKKSGHPFVHQCFVKLYKISKGKRASCCGTGARGTWQLMIFTYFASSSPSKFSWRSSFNLARSTSFFIGVTFFLLKSFLLKTSTQKEKHMLFYSCWWTGIFRGKHLPVLKSFFNKVAGLQP